MLKVYMVGLIYFNGCDELEKRMFAPDGRVGAFGVGPHRASLWINTDLVNIGATAWPERVAHVIDGVDVIEFQIPNPADIVFPVQNGPVSCDALVAIMPKLKKDKKDKKKDDEDEYFEIDPNHAETIARVTISGGELVPYDIKHGAGNFFGLVEWRIVNQSGLAITAGGRTITLVSGAAVEVVFSNIHPVDPNAKKDDLRGDHIQLFRKLNTTLPNNVTLVAHKPANLPDPDTDNVVIQGLRGAQFTCGVTPPCCARVVHGGTG